MTRQPPVVAALLTAGVLSGIPLAADPRLAAQRPTAVELLDRWVTAVRNHDPGRADTHVKRIAALSFAERRALDPGMRIFLSALTERSPVTRNDTERHAAELGLQASRLPGTVAFLRRAVMLHTDAAIVGPPAVDPTVPASGTFDGSPLLRSRRLSLSKDGEIIGHADSDWNWPFARSLVELIHAAGPSDRFVSDWYHATAAFMYNRGDYAEVSVHLHAAAAILPDDPRVLFDRAMYPEIRGLPMSQVLLPATDLITLRRWRQGTGRLPPNLSDAARVAAELDIPPKDEANENAENLFRRTLKADPAFSEARVRLARLLIERKRHDEALVELHATLDGRPEPIVAFYANLFAGRAEQALGRLDAARERFQEASRLFPSAQSALLALSQLSLLRADVPDALARIDRLAEVASLEIQRDDPWWRYHLGPGRDWEALLEQIWKPLRAR